MRFHRKALALSLALLVLCGLSMAPAWGACIPSVKTITEACAPGMQGSVISTITHVCPGDYDDVTRENNCKPPCEASTYNGAMGCPDGQVGHIDTLVTHVCPEDKDVVKVVGSTCVDPATLTQDNGDGTTTTIPPPPSPEVDEKKNACVCETGVKCGPCQGVDAPVIKGGSCIVDRCVRCCE